MVNNRYGDWTITSSLSEGGQAHTFRAAPSSDPSNDKFVLKRLKNNRRIGRFRQEVEAGRRLRHDNLVRIVDSDLDGDRPFIVSDFYPLGHLRVCMLRHRTLLDRLQLFAGVCRGAAYAHQHNIVHRDIKPDNIFVAQDGTPVVGDFGLCFIDEAPNRYTEVDEGVGPRLYIAPELEGGRTSTVSPTSDVYSLGKLLYWLLAGRVFDRERQREPEWHLNLHGDRELAFVYEFLDATITADISSRLKDGTQVLEHLAELVRRIESRRHLYELAAAASSIDQPSGVSLPTFTRESIVVRRGVPEFASRDTSFNVGRTALGFCRARLAEGADAKTIIEIGLQRGANAPTTLSLEREGAVCPQRDGVTSAIAFDSSDQPLVAVVAEENGTAFLNVAAPWAGVDDIRIPNVGKPVTLALAAGPQGEWAACIGTKGPRESASELFFCSGGIAERTPLPHQPTYPASLAFAHDGTLHVAYAIGLPGVRETRRLVHWWREPEGLWRDEAVAEAHAGPMSGHIATALLPNGQPVILSNWTGDGPDSPLACHRKSDLGWIFSTVDVTWLKSVYGFARVDTAGPKKLVAARDGVHAVVRVSGGGQDYVLYLKVSLDLTVQTMRVFPATSLNGFGVDERETVFIALAE